MYANISCPEVGLVLLAVTLVFNDAYKIVSASECVTFQTPLQQAYYQALSTWGTGDYRALSRLYAENGTISWQDRRTNDKRTAEGFEELVALWEGVMSLIENGEDIKIGVDFNERDRIALVNFSWPNSNFLCGTHVLVYDSDYKILRSNIETVSKPGPTETVWNLGFGHWGAGDLLGVKNHFADDVVHYHHNMKDGSNKVVKGKENVYDLWVEEDTKMTDKSSFEIINLEIFEETRQTVLVSKIPGVGLNFWSGTFTYNEDFKISSMSITMDRDW